MKRLLFLLFIVWGVTIYAAPIHTTTYENGELRVKYDLSSLSVKLDDSGTSSFQCDGFGLVHSEGRMDR